jgi:hypothetical protein
VDPVGLGLLAGEGRLSAGMLLCAIVALLERRNDPSTGLA